MRGTLLVLLTLAAGCDDPLTESQRIESTRVIGARVESGAEPEQAWPAPADTASMRWLVADPRPAPQLGWAFSLCIGEPTTRGVPECAAQPFAELRSNGLSADVPSFSFQMPSASALAGTDRVLARGVICSDAEPVLAEPLERSTCAGDLTLALLEIGIRRDGASNRNPTLQGEPIMLDGAPWLEPTPAELALASCAAADGSASLPVLGADGADHAVSVALSEDDREPIERLSGPDLEDLFVSHFSNLGRFERPVSVIDPGATPSVSVALRAPKSVQGSGEIARAWFVVRDLRGGVDWALRAVCFVP